ncbi:ABC transporter permease [Paenibacillus thiaminolyticus]|uniref:ABC transporter permease n=1 Tax=Paenibacillus thiaminolyticus TaxID=49283 RepID=UPI00232B92F2|nr:ABC transporter permease [Paenibacillus thiaminolyticus]WCF09198.1 ABC transporter permease [Paenibacillus thiaminolyticus]
MKRWAHSLPFIAFAAVLLYLFVPVCATLLYSMATSWNKTILPEGLTLHWFGQLFQDTRFVQAFGRSLLLSGAATFTAVLVIVPATFAIALYAPRLERWMQSLVMLTYAVPGVIMAVGLIRAYSGKGLSMIIIVFGAYVIGMLPFMYQGTRNSLRAVQAGSLMEAAELLGASRMTAFLRVIVPNIMPGILVSALLSFSLLFGEFVLINILVGGRFETMQLYLYAQLNTSGHIASAISVTYFILMGMLSAWIVKLTARASKPMAEPRDDETTTAAVPTAKAIMSKEAS